MSSPVVLDSSLEGSSTSRMHDLSGLLRQGDWSRSPLGAPETWTLSLMTTVSMILASHAQIVLFWGPEFVALYNDAYAATIGKKHPRALGRPAVENWTELWDDLEPLLRGVRETGNTFSARDRPFYIERHGYGETVYFDVSYSAVPEADASVGGVLCVVSETTQRVLSTRRGAALLDLEDKLRVIQHAEEAKLMAANLLHREVVASSVRYVDLDAQPEAQRAHGQMNNDPSLSEHDALMADGGSPGMSALVSEPRVEVKEQTCTLDIPLLRNGKVVGQFSVDRALPRCWADDEILFARSIVERAWSASERMRAEALLRKSEAEYRTLFEQIDEGLCVVELLDGEHGALSDYVHLEVNPAFALHSGLSDVVGKRLRELFPQEADGWMETMRQVLFTGEPIRVEREFAAAGRYLEVGAFRVPSADRRRLALLLKDVTARKRDEAELQRLNRELEERVAQAVEQREEAFARVHEMQKMETIGQLTGGVAHDFNNLLTPIVGALEMVARLQSDARIKRLTSAGLQAAERARTLIQRLLAFARRQHLQARPTDIRSLVCGMEDLLKRSLGPQVLLKIRCASDLPPAMVDPNQLELALLNLAVNARDAMPGGGELTIDVAEQKLEHQSKLADGRYVVIAVSDTGMGMDAQTIKRAVEPFFTTKTKGQGTGLGLSMVHGLAEQLGGRFALASEPERGTTATLWLPASAELTDIEPERVPALTEMRRVQDVPVLLVDDEELVRHGTAEMLADAGYVVRQACSAHEALAMLSTGIDIKALITDFAMPGMTGIELARQAAVLRPTLPVLVITGFASMNGQVVDKLPRLAKPFRQTELVDAVSVLLEKTARRQEQEQSDA